MRGTLGKISFPSRLLGALLAVVFMIAQPVLAMEPRTALLISSYHPGFPTFFNQIEGIRSVLDGAAVSLDVEFMDSKRYYQDKYLKNFHRSLSSKLTGRSGYDIILTADDNALLFALENRDKLFPQTPIVFFGVNSTSLADRQNDDPQVTGVVEAVSIRETVDLMKRLHPEVKRVVALVDGTVSGQGDLESFYRTCKKSESWDVCEISLEKLSFESFADKLRQADRDCAMLLISAYRDKTGRTLSFKQSLRLIRSHLERPIYHLWEYGLGEGVLGGKVISHYDQGRTAALIALEVLGGRPVAEIPVVSAGRTRFMFDYKELERFNIKTSALPENSLVLNPPHSFYQEHRQVVLIAGSLFGALLLVIFYLAAHNIRRKRAEQVLEVARDTLEAQVAQRNLDLEEANQELQEEIAERQKSEAKYRKLFENAIDPIFIEQSWVIRMANPAAGQILGYRPERLIGTDLRRYIHPADRAEVVAGRERQAAAERDFSVSALRIKNRAGETRWIEVRGVGITWEGDPAGLNFVRDITAQKLAEEEVRKSRRRSRELYRKTPAMLHTIDAEGRLVNVNDHWLTKMGYDREEVIGRNLSDFLTEESRESAAGVSRPEFFRTDRAGRIPSRFVTKDGRTLDILLSASAETDDDGRVIRSLAALEDITERKKAELALKESEARYRTLIRKIQAAIVVHGPDTKIITANKKARELLGLTKDQLRGRAATHPEWRFVNDSGLTLTTGEYPVNRVIGTGRPVKEMVVGIVRPELGDMVWVLVNADPVSDAQGRLEQVIVTFVDISRSKLLEAEREELIVELRDALSEIKELRGFLPICSRCKKIRDDSGYWQQVEEYIEDRTDARFSHSICPDCAEMLYPDLVGELEDDPES